MAKTAQTTKRGPQTVAANAAPPPQAARPAPTEALLREAGPVVISKLAEMAREGDVRAATLIFKLLEKDENDGDKKKKATITGFKRMLAKIERGVVAEIISLLAEADARTAEALEGVEPAN